jgi:sulfur carrier protein
LIRVNRRTDIEWDEGMTVSGLLERLNYTFPHIIVKVDGELVRQEAYDTRTIPDGADVRIIHLIAGG